MKGKKGFQKGEPRPETSGRRLGSINRVTRELKPKLAEFLSGKLEVKEMEKLWKQLKPAEQAKFIPALLPYIIPKQQELEINEGPMSKERAREIILALVEDKSENETT